MSQPLGFIHPNFPSHVCRLHKAIYGLCQSPRAWYSRLSSHLFDLGLCISLTDPSLFIQSSKTCTTFVLVYMDDLLITRSSSSYISKLIIALRVDFSITDLGYLHYFLGVEATFNSTGLLLTQQKYITDLLFWTNMHLTKPVKTLISTIDKLSAISRILFANLKSKHS